VESPSFIHRVQKKSKKFKMGTNLILVECIPAKFGSHCVFFLKCIMCVYFMYTYHVVPFLVSSLSKEMRKKGGRYKKRTSIEVE